MGRSYHIFIWKKAPFLRLLVPLIVGILLEYYFNIKIRTIIYSGIISLILLFAFAFLTESKRFALRWIHGIMISLFLVLFGSFISWQKDIRNHQNWYGNFYRDSSFIVVRIVEPPVEKAKSFKAVASVESCINNGLQRDVTGNVIIYFAKDSFSKRLHYGDKIIVSKQLKDIKTPVIRPVSIMPGTWLFSKFFSRVI